MRVARRLLNPWATGSLQRVVLVLVLIKDNATIKRMLSHWASVHPGSFLMSGVIL